MLLVDDGEAEFFELHFALEQGVRADHQLCAAVGDALDRQSFLFAAQRAGEPRGLDAERTEQCVDLAEMLLGKDFGGRHERRLIARVDGLRARERRDHGLAAADVALQQAPHRVRLRQVVANFRQAAVLRMGQLERQRGEQLLGQTAPARQDRRAALCASAAEFAHGKLLRQEFVELQAPPRRVRACFQRG